MYAHYRSPVGRFMLILLRGQEVDDDGQIVCPPNIPYGWSMISHWPRDRGKMYIVHHWYMQTSNHEKESERMKATHTKDRLVES